MIDDETAGILVEPIQGEGGVRATTHAVPEGPARDLRRVRPAAVLRRDPHGFRPDRQDVGLRLVGRRSPTSRRSPRAWAAASRSAPSWRPRRRRSAWCRARTARPMAAIRWPRASPTPCSTSCWSRASSTACASAASTSRASSKALVKKHPKVYVEQRGTGFLQGMQCAADGAGGRHGQSPAVARTAGAARRRERDPHLPGADRRQGRARRGHRHPEKAAQSFEAAKAAE